MKALLEILLKYRKAQVLVFLLVAVVMADAGFYIFRTSPASSGTAAASSLKRR